MKYKQNIENMVYMPYNKVNNIPSSFEVLFYEKENGGCPVDTFINSLDIKMRAKTLGLLLILEEKGYSVREPYSKHVADGIFEIRYQIGNNIIRILYFFFKGRKIILTNGFVKKNQKTPYK